MDVAPLVIAVAGLVQVLWNKYKGRIRAKLDLASAGETPSDWIAFAAGPKATQS